MPSKSRAGSSTTTKTDAHEGRKLGDIMRIDKWGDTPDPDEKWRYLTVLSQERDFVPNLETALLARTSKAQVAYYPSNLPVYRVPIDEMPNFEEWPHVRPSTGIKPTNEPRFLKLSNDIYARSIVFGLFHSLEYLVEQGKPWKKLKQANNKQTPERRRRRS